MAQRLASADGIYTQGEQDRLANVAATMVSGSLPGQQGFICSLNIQAQPTAIRSEAQGWVSLERTVRRAIARCWRHSRPKKCKLP
jgi:hypothetical protein